MNYSKGGGGGKGARVAKGGGSASGSSANPVITPVMTSTGKQIGYQVAGNARIWGTMRAAQAALSRSDQGRPMSSTPTASSPKTKEKRASKASIDAQNRAKSEAEKRF